MLLLWTSEVLFIFLKAGFQRRSRNCNQKRRVNQSDGVVNRVSDSAYDFVACDPVKTRLSESQGERKHSEGLRASAVIVTDSDCDCDSVASEKRG